MIKKNGFTLLELLVVIGIIGILLALVTVGFTSAQKQSRDTRRRQDLAAIQNALEQYYAQNSFVYPTGSGCAAHAQVDACTLIDSYFSGGIPVDPLNTGSNVYTFLTLNSSGYTVTARMEKDASTISITNLQ